VDVSEMEMTIFAASRKWLPPLVEISIRKKSCSLQKRLTFFIYVFFFSRFFFSAGCFVLFFVLKKKATAFEKVAFFSI